MIAILQAPEVQRRDSRRRAPDILVAHKTGSITRIHHDAGIVYAGRPYVVVLLVRGIQESEGKRSADGAALEDDLRSSAINALRSASDRGGVRSGRSRATRGRGASSGSIGIVQPVNGSSARSSSALRQSSASLGAAARGVVQRRRHRRFAAAASAFRSASIAASARPNAASAPAASSAAAESAAPRPTSERACSGNSSSARPNCSAAPARLACPQAGEAGAVVRVHRELAERRAATVLTLSSRANSRCASSASPRASRTRPSSQCRPLAG